MKIQHIIYHVRWLTVPDDRGTWVWTLTCM